MSGVSPSVVQVVIAIDRGGLETMCADLAIALHDRGIRSSVLGLDAGGELEDRLRTHGVAFASLGGREMRRAEYYKRIAATMKGWGATAVHTHGFAPLLYTALARPLAGWPTLVHTEHSIEYLLDRPALRFALRGLALQVSTFAVLGERMRCYYKELGIAARRLALIPNGVALLPPATAGRRGAARSELRIRESFVVGTVGRLAPEKNYGMLVDAFADAFGEQVDTALVFIGDGSERADLEARAVARGLTSRVYFAGWRRDVSSLLPAFDVFALSSHSEGLPMAMLEAMSAGIPVVSTAVGDIPRVVTHGESGRLVPEGERAALAQALGAAGADASGRERMGGHARRVVTDGFSRDAMVSAYCRAYGIPAHHA